MGDPQVGKFMASAQTQSLPTKRPIRIELLPKQGKLTSPPIIVARMRFFIPMNLCEGFIVMNLMGLQFWRRMQEHVFQFSGSSRSFFFRGCSESVQRSCIFIKSYSINFCGTSLKSWLKDFLAKMFKLQFAEMFFCTFLPKDWTMFVFVRILMVWGKLLFGK